MRIRSRACSAVPPDTVVMSGSRTDFFTTARLGFDCWKIDDLTLAKALWGDPEVTAPLGGPFREEQIVKRLEAEIAVMTTCGAQYWPIFLLEGGQHAGCAGPRPYRMEEGLYELGYHLRPEYWRIGLAQEAARAAVSFGFETIGARVLFAGPHPDKRSIAPDPEAGIPLHSRGDLSAHCRKHQCYFVEKRGLRQRQEATGCGLEALLRWKRRSERYKPDRPRCPC